MISQEDIPNATEESKFERELSGQGISLRQSLHQFSKLLDTPKTLEQLRSEVSQVLMAQPLVFAVFFLDLNDSDLGFRLIGSNVDQIADNVKQWAANIAINCCTTGQTKLEQSDDVSNESFQMVAVPGVGPMADSALVTMFSGNDSQENKLILVESANHCLTQWQSSEQLLIVTQAAKDLAAQDQLVAIVEDADSLNSACHVIAKELSVYVEALNKSASPTAPSATPPEGSNSSDAVDVYVGMTQDNRPLNLTALSNSNALPPQEQREAIEAAMQECLCRNTASAWPRDEENPAGVLCLKRMSAVIGAAHLVAYPVACAEGTAGVIIIASGRPMSARSFAFVDSCSARLGSALQLVKRAEPGRFQFLVDKIADIKNNRNKLALICLAVALTGLIPMPYYVSSECEVCPESKLFVASPFDTTLEKCFVQPGQQVTKDMPLAMLDGRETSLELAEVEADLNRAMKQRDGHVVSHDSGEAYVAKYEIQRLQSRRDLLRHRQESLELRSPMAGIVIAGDLKHAEGMPLQVGETLFEVAPLDQLRIELAIPEDDVRYTETEMTTKIRLDAFPFESWDGKIEQIHPASELKNDQNVFIAVVRIDNAEGKLRPGMTGYAKTKTIWRPVIWNYFHKPAAATARWFGW